MDGLDIKTNLSDIIKEELDKNNVITPSENKKEQGGQKKKNRIQDDSKSLKNAEFLEKSSFGDNSKQNIKLSDIIEEELAKKDIITPPKHKKKSPEKEKGNEPRCCNCGYKGEMTEKLSFWQGVVLFCVTFCIGAGFGISWWWFLGGLFGFILFGALIPDEKDKIYVCPKCKAQQNFNEKSKKKSVKK